MAKVESLRCDQCGKVEEIVTFAKTPGAINMPPGWLVVVTDGPMRYDFCSTLCLRRWAEARGRAEEGE